MQKNPKHKIIAGGKLNLITTPGYAKTGDMGIVLSMIIKVSMKLWLL